MKKTKMIAIHASQKEYADFLFIQEKLNRSSESDTLRAMINIMKKNLSEIADISASAPTQQNS